MADVSHELGSLRYLVDSPLSSKVAMFNNQVSRHQESQSLNPFSQTDGRASPKPQIGNSDYGKPLAGSLTERRGQNANIHVLKEMLELCQIIDSEGYKVQDEPSMKVIPFGELFNIYTYISDKVVGILLRARKHKLVDFEGECLFQRRDDNVPVFLLKPIKEIRQILEEKQEEIRRSASPAPQATSILMDKQRSVSPSVASSKSKTKIKTDKPKIEKEKTKSDSSENLATKPPTGSIKLNEDITNETIETLQVSSQIITNENPTGIIDNPTMPTTNTAERPQTPTIVINDENNVEIHKEISPAITIIADNNVPLTDIKETVPTINIEEVQNQS